VEIQSLSTTRYDLTQKFDLYEASGVREYWVVTDAGVLVYILQPDGKYDDGTKYESYERKKIPVHIFDGSEIDVTDVFS
jgi:Uma2 family endonuclease